MRMNTPRVLLVIAALGTAVVLQASLLARLGLPGATPALLLVVVLTFAMSAGPAAGAIIGFSAGVLVDLAPPSAGSLGQTAAIYAIAGFLAGFIELKPGRADLQSVATVSGLSVGVVVAQALLASLIGSPEVTWSIVPVLLLTQLLYAAVLSLFVIPIVGMLYRGAAEDRRFA
jgi:rod shape-determining protein MreD